MKIPLANCVTDQWLVLHLTVQLRTNTASGISVEDNDTSNVQKIESPIPENINLSEAEKSVLWKGLNFIPIKAVTREFTTKEDCEKFYWRPCLKHFFTTNI